MSDRMVIGFFGNLCQASGNLRSAALFSQNTYDNVSTEEEKDLKITINVDDAKNETEIAISCKELTPEIETIIATLRMINQQLLVVKDEENYLLDVAKIIYIEAMERKTFIYTMDDVYESKLKLYEMEERLCQSGFLRVSKSCLVRLKYISSIKNEVERKLRLTLKNGEQIIVSRQYAEEIKKRLGVL